MDWDVHWIFAVKRMSCQSPAINNHHFSVALNCQLQLILQHSEQDMRIASMVMLLLRRQEKLQLFSLSCC